MGRPDGAFATANFRERRKAEVHWQPAGRSVRTLCGVGLPRSPPTTAALTSLAPCARGRSTVQDIEDHHTNQRARSSLCSGSQDRPASIRVGGVQIRPSTGPSSTSAASLGLPRHVPGCPTTTTGVSNKRRHAIIAAGVRRSAQISRTSPSPDLTRTYRGSRQMSPGCPTSGTGAPSKNYRGSRQMLPGSSTSGTGVPSKNYRGPQQIAFS